ncbi:MAG: hypothetical protein ACFCBW_20495 [Candidatus Competibacterales bacterium]
MDAALRRLLLSLGAVIIVGYVLLMAVANGGWGYPEGFEPGHWSYRQGRVQLYPRGDASLRLGSVTGPRGSLGGLSGGK